MNVQQEIEYECGYCGMMWKEKPVQNAYSPYGKALKGTCPRCEERAPYARIKSSSESPASDRPSS